MNRSEEAITLFNNKTECCGCGACMNICPKNAVKMTLDDAGFLYPVIDRELCIGCGQCQKVCAYQNLHHLAPSGEVYAAVSKNSQLLMRSASGGIFAEIAGSVLASGGCVYGAAFVKNEDTLAVRHICASATEELTRLQGSKYVQSFTGYSYREVKTKLNDGISVLYSGTPCQIAGLKGYLGKEYDNLFTVDIICHGVPSQKFFEDYLAYLMNQWQGKIDAVCFRDKSKGWGLNASFTYDDKNGKSHTKMIPFRSSSYYDMFIKAETYRENCYTCPYAGPNRVGDLTLGDFWGIQNQHPEWMKMNGGSYDEEQGISCVLVNTEKGRRLLDSIENKIERHLSDFQKVSAENFQLVRPSIMPDTRQTILDLYTEQGYAAVEAFFNQRVGIRKYYYLLKSMIPRKWKVKLKALIR